MKKSNQNKSWIVTAIFCIAFFSHPVLAQSWNVKIIPPGQFEVTIKPSEFMGGVIVGLTITYSNNETKEEKLPFTNNEQKYLRAGNIYGRRYQSNKSIRSVRGRYIHYYGEGSGDKADDASVTFNQSSGGTITGEKTLIRTWSVENVEVIPSLRWMGWREIAGGRTTDVAPAACDAYNTTYLFAKGVDEVGAAGNDIYMNTKRSGSWTGWAVVPGMKTNATLATVSYAGRIFLFAKSENNRCFYNSFALSSGGNQNWQGWQEVPGEATIMVAPQVCAMGGYLFLLAMGVNDSKIHFNRLNLSSAWRGWTAVTGNFNTNTQVVSCKDPQENRLWVFARNLDNKVYYNILTPGNNDNLSWSGWIRHPREGSINTALAVTRDAQKLYLFGKGTSNKIFYSVFSTATDRWTNWRLVSENRPTDFGVAVTGWQRSRITLFCKGINNGRIYTNQQSQ